jgi:hypothetical protein
MRAPRADQHPDARAMDQHVQPDADEQAHGDDAKRYADS